MKSGTMKKTYRVDYEFLFGVVTWLPDNVVLHNSKFLLGEVLILDRYGKEPSGRCRKPSDFNVQIEIFTTVLQAVLKAQEITL